MSQQSTSQVFFRWQDVEMTITGRLLRVARAREEWDTDVEDPEAISQFLRTYETRVDIFSFIQRLPASKPKHDYYMEWDNVAAIPISTYDNWLNRQIHRNARNKLKKAQREGVVARVTQPDDAWFRGIQEVQDESPLRQGTPFSHYKEDISAVRRGHSTYLDRGTCVAAYHGAETIGFLKIVTTKGFARPMGILTKAAHNDKAPMNALIAKAVEICAERRIPFFVYGKYYYGNVGSESLLDIKRYHGFEHILLPRYYIPLTALGKAALRLKLHRSLKQVLPRWFLRRCLELRAQFYLMRRRTREFQAGSHCSAPLTQKDVHRRTA